MMAIQKNEKTTNGRNFGFDVDADFIPFEMSDEEVRVDDSRPESQVSADSVPPPPLSDSTTRTTNGDGRKRKRRDYESSPERGAPPLQRQKFRQVSVNPWQSDINDYASCKETARMYLALASPNINSV